MHLKCWFSVTFAIDGSFIRPILYINRDFLRNLFGLFAKEESSKSQSSKKQIYKNYIYKPIKKCGSIACIYYMVFTLLNPYLLMC